MQQKFLIAGVDEVGIGCIAGPVVAAAVVFLDPIPESLLEQLDDSKKIKADMRQKIFLSLSQLSQVKISVAAASVKEIFALNIRNAASLAMQRAIRSFPFLPHLVLVDGTIFPDFGCATQAIIKGDGFSYSIAAASIVAKVVRDRLMHRLARYWDQYGWKHNVGYPTAFHRKALEEFGCSPHHRQGFTTVKQLSFKMNFLEKR